jgi:hypothetical protein
MSASASTVPTTADHAEERMPDDRRRSDQARARAVRAAARTAARAVAPTRSPAFAHLSLDELRTYRQTLLVEEDRVSYWRRILQARLDLLRAGETRSPDDVGQLRSVLGSEQVNDRRQALVTIVPADDVPPLPDLARLWATSPDPRDAAAQAVLDYELATAETELSAYRSALHRRLSAATLELIARYREQPRLCLRALPLPGVQGT